MICVTSRLLRQLSQQLLALTREIRGDVVVDRVEHLADVEIVCTDDRLAQFGSQSLGLGGDPLLKPLASTPRPTEGRCGTAELDRGLPSASTSSSDR